VALAAVCLGGPARAGEAWIDTWSASPQPITAGVFEAGPDVPRRLEGQTIRQVARVSLGGARLRVEISNEFGDRPLTIGAAAVGLAAPDGGGIVPGSSRPLSFGGQRVLTIPPGAPAWSDPVALAVPDLGRVAVSLYLPGPTPVTTIHRDGRSTAWISGPGDFTGAERFTPAATTQARLFLSGLAVPSAPAARAVIVLGDSITDGDGSTPDADRRWPDRLAERLAAAGAAVAVLNEGVSGALLLRDALGPNALARFDRDVLGHPRADTLVVAIGINDIGWPDESGGPAPEDLVAGYRQLIGRARAHGMTVVGATLTPFGGGPREPVRAAVNAWIRDCGGFDAVIDFDAALRDPAEPTRMLPVYDSGDGLHPSDAGYAALAAAVNFGRLGLTPAPGPRR
jgi:lysophospholipase L1-like esterase